MSFRIKEKQRKLNEAIKLKNELYEKYKEMLTRCIELGHELNSSYTNQYCEWLRTEGKDKFKIGDPIMVVRNHSHLTYSSCPYDYTNLRGVVIDIIGNTLEVRVKNNSQYKTIICTYAEVELDYNLYKEDFADYVRDYEYKSMQKSMQKWLS